MFLDILKRNKTLLSLMSIIALYYFIYHNDYSTLLVYFSSIFILCLVRPYSDTLIYYYYQEIALMILCGVLIPISEEYRLLMFISIPFTIYNVFVFFVIVYSIFINLVKIKIIKIIIMIYSNNIFFLKIKQCL